MFERGQLKFLPSFFKKLAVSKGRAFGRRRAAGEIPQASPELAVNFCAGCLWRSRFAHL